DDLGRRHALLGVDVDRDAAAVVAHGDRAVMVEHHVDLAAVAGERLVDRVVDDLVDHVVQARAVVGVADVHAGPFAHGVEPAQDLDRVGGVGLSPVGFPGVSPGVFGELLGGQGTSGNG